MKNNNLISSQFHIDTLIVQDYHLAYIASRFWRTAISTTSGLWGIVLCAHLVPSRSGRTDTFECAGSWNQSVNPLPFIIYNALAELPKEGVGYAQLLAVTVKIYIDTT